MVEMLFSIPYAKNYLFENDLRKVQPPGPTTHVSELTVLTITSIHCGGVPTRIETADQVPSSPYLPESQQGLIAYSQLTDHCSEGVTLKAVGVLITHCINDATAAPTHLDTQCIVNNSVASCGQQERCS